MITKMTGVLQRVLDDEARIQIGPLEYQVMVPEFVRRNIQDKLGQEITLHITEYLEGNPNQGRMVPRRIGFGAESELEFFELFCTVDKVGVKKALKALGRPIKEIADAIQRQDAKWLTTLPGIGKTTAEQIVATLRSKVTRFALMPASAGGAPLSPADAATAVLFEDAYAALMSLGLSPADARTRIDQVISSGKACKSVEEVISLVFRKQD